MRCEKSESRAAIGQYSDACLTGWQVVNSRTEPVEPVKPVLPDQSNSVPSNSTNSTEAGFLPISTLNQTNQSDDDPDPLHVNCNFISRVKFFFKLITVPTHFCYTHFCYVSHFWLRCFRVLKK